MGVALTNRTTPKILPQLVHKVHSVKRAASKDYSKELLFLKGSRPSEVHSARGSSRAARRMPLRFEDSDPIGRRTPFIPESRTRSAASRVGDPLLLVSGK